MNPTQAPQVQVGGQNSDVSKAANILDMIESLDFVENRLASLLDSVRGPQDSKEEKGLHPKEMPTLQYLLINGSGLIADKIDRMNGRISELEDILTT